MDPAGVDRLIRLLPYQLVGVVPFGVLLVLARAHVAIQNSRIMVSMGVLNACLNAAMNVALLRPLGLEGLALATSVTHAMVALVFAVRLRGRLAPSPSAAIAAAAGST
jgi:putative peptidoglycan lipid II flippase